MIVSDLCHSASLIALQMKCILWMSYNYLFQCCLIMLPGTWANQGHVLLITRARNDCCRHVGDWVTAQPAMSYSFVSGSFFLSSLTRLNAASGTISALRNETAQFLTLNSSRVRYCQFSHSPICSHCPCRTVQVWKLWCTIMSKVTPWNLFESSCREFFLW